MNLLASGLCLWAAVLVCEECIGEDTASSPVLEVCVCVKPHKIMNVASLCAEVGEYGVLFREIEHRITFDAVANDVVWRNET
uniref:Putative secreted protein n=1 Tax=Anopheles marajoara TaxID=58244 RepID=A0A2M4CBX0_9DIPT